MTLRVALFIEANRQSPVEYFSASGTSIVVRLVDGSRWEMTGRQLREAAPVRFAQLELVDA